MVIDNVMMDVKQFKDRQGTQRWYIAYMREGQYVRAWEQTDKSKDRIEQVNVPIANIPVNDLKFLNLWELLSEKQQHDILVSNNIIVENTVPKIENGVKIDGETVTNNESEGEGMDAVETVAEVVGTVAVANVPKKRGRKACPELVGVPRVIKCSCGVETHVNPRTVLESATAAGQTVADWVAAYKCRKCRESKG